MKVRGKKKTENVFLFFFEIFLSNAFSIWSVQLNPSNYVSVSAQEAYISLACYKNSLHPTFRQTE